MDSLPLEGSVADAAEPSSTRLESGYFLDHEWVLDYERGVGFLRSPAGCVYADWLHILRLIGDDGWQLDTVENFFLSAAGNHYYYRLERAE